MVGATTPYALLRLPTRISSSDADAVASDIPTVAALLIWQLGNLDFASAPSEHEGEGCQPSDHLAVDLVARLLEVPPATLAASLTRRRLSVRNQNVIMRTQSLQQARCCNSCNSCNSYNSREPSAGTRRWQS